MLQRRADECPGGYFPQPGGAVHASGQDSRAIGAKADGIDSAGVIQNRPQRAELAVPASQLGADEPLEVYLLGWSDFETVRQQEHRGAHVSFLMQGPALVPSQASQRLLGLAA